MNLSYHDLETFSTVPIGHGTHRYAEAGEVLLWPYAFGEGPVSVWDVTAGGRMPSDLEDCIADERVMTVWHNGGMFDTVVLPHALGINLPIERVHDTMVQALCHGLPGSLGDLCEILGVPTDKAKDKEGRTFIHLFCKERPANSELRRATSKTHPAEWARFVEYARLDVEAMRAVYKKLPKWNYQGDELALWHLDQRINRRGVAVDMALADAALAAADKEKKTLAARASEITDGEVPSTTQRDVLLAHILAEYGITLPDMQMATLERRIADPALPPELKELLQVRLQASSTSVAKYRTLARGVSKDGRVRGTLQFCGASRTGRWAGRLVQLQNLPRPTHEQADIDLGIEAVKAGCADLVFDNVMALLSSSIRGLIVAPPGKKLVVADLANIEGRMAAWLAGEQWKLHAFREFDAGRGADLYKVAYAKAFGIDPGDVDKAQRQIGKVMELMLQYQGGVGAFITGAATYGIDLAAMADAALPSIPGDVLHDAEGFYDWTVKQHRSTFGLPRHVFVACDSLKRLWRGAHQAIETLWYELEDTYKLAIQHPGQTFTVRKLKARRDGAWLRVRLPSGRYLCYPSPKIEDGKITYMGVDQYSRRWTRLGLYGGKALEQATQGASRDQLAGTMPAVEADGFELISTVHDEDITEAPDSDEYTGERLAALIAQNLPWNAGLPLAAEGFSAYRYRK